MVRKLKKQPGPFASYLFPLEEMEKQAIDFIKRYEPPEGYYLADSGGKDSRVVRKLAQMAGVKFKAFYSCTKIDPPEVPRFLRQHFPDTTWHYPKKSFYWYIRNWFPPTIFRKWC